MQAHSVSLGSRACWQMLNFLTASTTSASADQTAGTWQSHLRPGCCLHAVPFSNVVVAIGHICIYIYAKRSIQIYILIFYFIFLSEVVCFTLHLCIQIFVYFSEIFSFYYSSKTVSTLNTALLICFHLDAMFPHIVWNQNQKATYDITSSYKVYVGWNYYTDSLSSVLYHTLSSFIL